jgi:hypothetical protein
VNLTTPGGGGAKFEGGLSVDVTLDCALSARGGVVKTSGDARGLFKEIRMSRGANPFANVES